MADDPKDVDPDADGSTPADDEGVPADDDTDAGSTPADDDDDAGGDDDDDSDDDGDDETDDDTDDDDDDDDADDDDKPAARDATVETEDPEDDPEWRNLSSKFAHIKNPRDRRAQIAKAYWGKAKYARMVANDNRALRKRIQELESGAPKDKEHTTDEPHPDLVKADQRIEALKTRGTALLERRKAAVLKVNEADRELAIAKRDLARIRPEDDEGGDKKRLAEKYVKDSERDLESATDRFQSIEEDRRELGEKLAQAETDRDWIKQFQAEQKDKKQSEQTTREQFDAEFPKHVDRLVLKSAKKQGIDIKDKTLRRSLIRNVNRALILELGAQGDADLARVDLAGMVKSFVHEYAIDRDLAKRKNFTKASRDKLTVARPGSGTTERRPTSTPARPAGSSKPVPVSLMGSSATDGMLAARRRLVSKFG
jgi:hypothetical protein